MRVAMSFTVTVGINIVFDYRKGLYMQKSRKTRCGVNLEAYLFILPILFLFAVFVVYPIAFNGYYSFFKWNGMSANKQFIGTANYIKLFKDPVFVKILSNFFIFAVITIISQAALGITFAFILVRKVKLSTLFRTLIYLPVAITPTIVGNVFSRIYETNQGDLNMLLRSLHLDVLTQQWLADPKIALYAIAAVNIWQWTGYSMLMYYANMLNIPDDVYEAAVIDGASSFQQFFHISLPLLRSTHFTLFVMGALGSLKCFDLPFILTNGGPNHATEFFSTYIYSKSFINFDQGMSSTIVIVLIALALIITIAQLKVYGIGGRDKELAER